MEWNSHHGYAEYQWITAAGKKIFRFNLELEIEFKFQNSVNLLRPQNFASSFLAHRANLFKGRLS